MNKRRHKTLAFVVPGLVVIIGLGVAMLYLQRRSGPVLPPLKPAPVYVEKSTPADRKASHNSMLDSLAVIKERAPKDHQYFGREAHLELRNELEDLSADAPPAKRFRILSNLGINELAFGSTRSAIETLTQALELVPRVQFPNAQIQLEWVYRTKLHLGVACLRLGETQNCCLRHSAESCILPIRGGGIHTNQAGSRQAIRHFLELLRSIDGQTEDWAKSASTWNRQTAIWLVNIAAMTIGAYPDELPEQYRIPKKFFESEIPFPRFENIAPKLKIDTFNQAGGVIVDDFDNDNHLDIFVSTSDPTGQTRYFRNKRDGSFEDRTEAAGLIGFYGGLNMVQADYNNDGHLDVYIVRGAWHGEHGQHPDSLLRNNGDGTFSDVSFDAGLAQFRYPVKSAAWGDYDNDGDVDLFVANETSIAREDKLTQRVVTTAMHAPWQLFRNNGDGTFTDVAAAAGVNLAEFGMGVVFGDYDADRFPDLFVSSGRGSHLFRNNGNGSFTDVTKKLKLTRPRSPFPVWFWDFNNDGVLDIYASNTSGHVGVLATDAMSRELETPQSGFALSETRWGPMQYELAALYRGDGRGGFEEIASRAGLRYPTEPMGANFGDLNGDGYLDFYLATGDIFYWELRPNVMFLSSGGRKFVNVTMAGGFGHLQKGHGVSFADIDNDGDQDVYVQMGGQYPEDKYSDALFQNPGFGNHWITVKLVGRRTNRSAIGARIQVRVVEGGRERSIYRHVNSGGSFGGNPLRQNIGLGKAERIAWLEVYWPTSDRTETFRAVALDQMVRIVEGKGIEQGPGTPSGGPAR